MVEEGGSLTTETIEGEEDLRRDIREEKEGGEAGGVRQLERSWGGDLERVVVEGGGGEEERRRGGEGEEGEVVEGGERDFPGGEWRRGGVVEGRLVRGGRRGGGGGC